jgi:chitinase
MIVWGGDSGGAYLDTGGSYDPATGAWTATTTVGAPAARNDHTAVWTTAKMVVWGGYNGSLTVNTGGMYDPSPTPGLSIGDATVTEGNAGTKSAILTVTLAPPSAQVVTVNFATADGTAAAPGDYAAASGTLTFAPGQTSQQIAVSVNGDPVVEPDETFLVNLGNPTNAVIVDGQAVGTITNDDLPAISIDDVTTAEGGSATFTVGLSQPSPLTVTVDYATADGAATAGSDYTPSAGPLAFPPGTTTQTLTLPVLDDATAEPVETFFVNLSNPANATIVDGQGQATVVDDDPISFYTVPPCRLVDTRDPDGPLGGPALAARTDRVFGIVGSCELPATAKAVSVNLTVASPATAGHLRLYPAGTPRPLASTINYSTGQTRANNGIVPLNAAGEIAVYCGQASGTAHFILDVNGYFE